MNLVVTGDVHFYNWGQYQLEPDFRLNQYLQFANDLVRIGVENNSDELAIVGDLLQKPMLEPEVLHFFKQFFNILGKHFKRIYCISGQHDHVAKKKLGLTPKSTYLTLFNEEQFLYLQDDLISIGDHPCHFRSWLPKWEPISDKAEYFFGHAYLNGAIVIEQGVKGGIDFETLKEDYENDLIQF